MGLAAEVEHDGGGEEQGSRHGEQAALIVAGEVAREPHPIRPDEAAQDNSSAVTSSGAPAYRPSLVCGFSRTSPASTICGEGLGIPVRRRTAPMRASSSSGSKG